MISILIPCYNEAPIIRKTYIEIKKEIEKTAQAYEIIFADDGSTDATGKILRTIAALDKHVKLIEYYPNRGLGHAYRSLYKMGQGEILIQMDADLSMKPDIFKKFLEEIKYFDIVVASRYAGQKSTRQPLHRYLLSRMYNMLNRILFGITVKDTQSGFIAFRRKVIDSICLYSNRWEVHIELFYKIKKNNFRVKEMPAEYMHRSSGSKFNVLTDGLATLIKTIILFWEITMAEKTA